MDADIIQSNSDNRRSDMSAGVWYRCCFSVGPCTSVSSSCPKVWFLFLGTKCSVGKLLLAMQGVCLVQVETWNQSSLSLSHWYSVLIECLLSLQTGCDVLLRSADSVSFMTSWWDDYWSISEREFIQTESEPSDFKQSWFVFAFLHFVSQVQVIESHSQFDVLPIDWIVVSYQVLSVWAISVYFFGLYFLFKCPDGTRTCHLEWSI